jgi:hypothetical protein
MSRYDSLNLFTQANLHTEANIMFRLNLELNFQCKLQHNSAVRKRLFQSKKHTNFTLSSSESWQAGADESIDMICTCTTVSTRCTCTLIYI